MTLKCRHDCPRYNICELSRYEKMCNHPSYLYYKLSLFDRIVNRLSKRDMRDESTDCYGVTK